VNLHVTFLISQRFSEVHRVFFLFCKSVGNFFVSQWLKITLCITVLPPWTLCYFFLYHRGAQRSQRGSQRFTNFSVYLCEASLVSVLLLFYFTEVHWVYNLLCVSLCCLRGLCVTSFYITEVHREVTEVHRDLQISLCISAKPHWSLCYFFFISQRFTEFTICSVYFCEASVVSVLLLFCFTEVHWEVTEVHWALKSSLCSSVKPPWSLCYFFFISQRFTVKSQRFTELYNFLCSALCYLFFISQRFTEKSQRLTEI
jgi:hypothetical protein